MDNMEIDLFGEDNDANKVIMPGELNKESEEELQEQLVSADVLKAISAEQVKSVMLDEKETVDLPNYVIDLSQVDEVDPIQLMALDALLNEYGDTSIYLNTKTGLSEAGKGFGEILNKILAKSMAHIFNNKCRVYRNYELGKEPREITGKDMSNLRLTI